MIIFYFFTLYEDFLRQVIPKLGALSLILKDVSLFFIYIYFFWLFLSKNRFTVNKTFEPLIIYISIVFLSYTYTILGHKLISASIVGIRSELFYAPIALIVFRKTFALGFISKLFSLLYLTVLANCLVALLQFLYPDLLSGVPGFRGLEEVDAVNKVRSFNDDLINFLFGMYASADKLARSLVSMSILILCLHFLFSVGNLRNILIMGLIVTLVTLLSAKRLPFMIWIVIYLTTLFYLLSASRKAWAVNFMHETTSHLLKARRYAFVCLMSIVSVPLILIITIEDFLLYLEMVYYLFSTEVYLRFFAETGNDYFFQSEYSQLSSVGFVFGQGGGTNTVGVDYILDPALRDGMGLISLEHGPLAVVLELGVLGFVKLCVLWLIVIGRGTYLHLKIKSNYNFKLASLIILLYQFATLSSFFVGHSYWGDVQVQVYFWSIYGIQQYIFTRLNQRYAKQT